MEARRPAQFPRAKFSEESSAEVNRRCRRRDSSTAEVFEAGIPEEARAFVQSAPNAGLPASCVDFSAAVVAVALDFSRATTAEILRRQRRGSHFPEEQKKQNSVPVNFVNWCVGCWDKKGSLARFF